LKFDDLKKKSKSEWLDRLNNIAKEKEFDVNKSLEKQLQKKLYQELNKDLEEKGEK
jgi:hypothetical protein